MQIRIHVLAAALAACACLPLQAADSAGSAASGIGKKEVKQLKAQSEGQYKARTNVAEANEALNKADCTALEGAAARACRKEAKMLAKADKAHAKVIKETEAQQIKEIRK